MNPAWRRHHAYAAAVEPQRATFGMRALAAAIDFVLLNIVGYLFYVAVGVVLGQLLGFVLGIGYFGYFEGSPSGQTIGKRLVQIRVVDVETGGPIGTSRALVRYVGRIISTLVLLLGYLWMLWDPERQTWHDKIAGTVVVPTSAFPVEHWPG
jgi:uncharacterized RDD family membrane protein YckC